MAESKRKGCLKPFLLGVIALTATSMAVFYYSLKSDLYKPETPEYGVLAIENVNIWYGKDSVIKEVVIIEGPEISCVGSNCAIPDGAKRIDGEGLSAFPGLVDAALTFYTPTQESENLGVVDQIMDVSRQRPQVRKYLQENGITAARSEGDPDENILLLTNQLLNGELEGPRIFPGGRLFTAKGGHPIATLLAGNQEAAEAFVYEVDDLNAARQEVQSMLSKGLHGITIVLDDMGGVLPKLSLVEVQALTDQAHKYQAWVSIRIGSQEDMRMAAIVGADIIEYLPRDGLDSLTIASLQASKPVIIPFLTANESLLARELGDHRPDLGLHAKKLEEAGLRLAIGSLPGEGQKFGDQYWAEFEAMHAAGLSPQAILLASTLYPSQMVKADDIMGKVEVGYQSNLILVKGKPWKNALDLKEIQLVVQSGRIVFTKL